MVFRLWMIMMSLVLLSVAFIWVVQIFLFERNYADAAAAETQNRLKPIMESLYTEDVASDPHFLSNMSRIAGGELMLVNGAGELLAFYTDGHSIDLNSLREDGRIWFTVRKSHEYQQMLQGEPYQKWEKAGGRIFAFEIGIPVRYNGQRCYAILHNTLRLHTILELNRRQLILLTIILTAAASLLSALLSRQFTKPLYIIKNTIDRLAKNDFSVKAGLNRRDELGDLSQSVDELGQALQRVDVLRGEVIANVSHELKTPLTAISGMAEIMKNGMVKPEDVAGFAGDIYKESQRLIALVEDIIHLSRLDEGGDDLKREPTDMLELAKKAVGRIEPLAKQAGVSLAVAGAPFTVQGIPSVLEEMVYNLCDNAVKYNHSGGTVAISVSPKGKGGVVEVADTGIGIPIQDQQRVFERFYRVDKSHSKEIGGTGLGLSIVKHGAALHDARVELESAPGHGTTVRLIFPET